MLKTTIKHCRTALVAVAIAVTGFSTGCAFEVGDSVDEPYDTTAAEVQDAEHADADEQAYADELVELSDDERRAEDERDDEDEDEVDATVGDSTISHDKLNRGELDYQASQRVLPGVPVMK
jgi:hypothetical protein